MPPNVMGDDRSLVAARRLGIRRGGQVLLEEVELAVSPGEIVTLIGPNGAGKTTLVRLLLGLERPDSGRVLLDGEDMDGRWGRERELKKTMTTLPVKPPL